MIVMSSFIEEGLRALVAISPHDIWSTFWAGVFLAAGFWFFRTFTDGLSELCITLVCMVAPVTHRCALQFYYGVSKKEATLLCLYYPGSPSILIQANVNRQELLEIVGITRRCAALVKQCPDIELRYHKDDVWSVANDATPQQLALVKTKTDFFTLRDVIHSQSVQCFKDMLLLPAQKKRDKDDSL